jgi:hypothetical protein
VPGGPVRTASKIATVVAAAALELEVCVGIWATAAMAVF